MRILCALFALQAQVTPCNKFIADFPRKVMSKQFVGGLHWIEFRRMNGDTEGQSLC